MSTGDSGVVTPFLIVDFLPIAFPAFLPANKAEFRFLTGELGHFFSGRDLVGFVFVDSFNRLMEGFF